VWYDDYREMQIDVNVVFSFFWSGVVSQIFSSEATFSAVNECLQIMGGLGYMKSYPYERYVRDARALSMYEVCVSVCDSIFIILNLIKLYVAE